MAPLYDDFQWAVVPLLIGVKPLTVSEAPAGAPVSIPRVKAPALDKEAV
jgi:hypothetical protein